MEKLLTIAIPTYNRANLLERLLNAINNAYQETVEVIVSDNLSTDNTSEMVSKYSFVEYYCNEKNLGPDGNFLACYQRAKGKYVWLVGSDDVISENAIEIILRFIEKYAKVNIPVIFLNHTSFQGEFLPNNINGKPFIDVGNEYVTDNIEDFMSIVKQQMTFMSSFLLNREAFLQVSEPNKYNGTHFIHMCLAFETMVRPNVKYGVIKNICVYQDLTPENSEYTMNYAKMFEVFGKWMYWTLVELAGDLGFPKKQMKKIYKNAMFRYLIAWTIRSKAEKKGKDMEGFWMYCFPIVKKYAIGWMLVVPVAVLPSFLSQIYLFLKKRGYRNE